MTASAGGKGFPQWLRHSENKPKLMDGSERGWLTPATANTLIFSDDRDGGDVQQCPTSKPQRIFHFTNLPSHTEMVFPTVLSLPSPCP